MNPRDAGPIPYSPEWYERRNARARERRRENQARDPYPGTPEWDALPYYEKARISGYRDFHAANDWRALLAALRDCAARIRWHGENDPPSLHKPEDAAALGAADSLLAKHRGAGR